MVRRKFTKVFRAVLICAAVSAALDATGVGYASWKDSLQIKLDIFSKGNDNIMAQNTETTTSSAISIDESALELKDENKDIIIQPNENIGTEIEKIEEMFEALSEAISVESKFDN